MSNYFKRKYHNTRRYRATILSDEDYYMGKVVDLIATAEEMVHNAMDYYRNLEVQKASLDLLLASDTLNSAATAAAFLPEEEDRTKYLRMIRTLQDGIIAFREEIITE